jgi:hypothetical protein
MDLACERVTLADVLRLESRGQDRNRNPVRKLLQKSRQMLVLRPDWWPLERWKGVDCGCVLKVE